MGKLDVRVVAARNLANKEMFGTSDPYVLVHCEGKKFKTPVKNNTLSPQWDAMFSFIVTNPHAAQVHFEVFDSNMLSDTPMGKFSLNVNTLAQGQVVDNWFRLNNAKSGELRLRVMAVDFGVGGGVPPGGAAPYGQPQPQGGAYPGAPPGYGAPPAGSYPGAAAGAGAFGQPPPMAPPATYPGQRPMQPAAGGGYGAPPATASAYGAPPSTGAYGAPPATAPTAPPAPPAPAAGGGGGSTQKYIFEGGVMKLNPAYAASQAHSGQPTTQQPQALAVVSSMDDAAQATNTQQQALGAPMQMAESTQASIQIMQDDDYLKKFQSPGGFQPGEVLDKLTQYFARYEVPLGMVNKLCMLSEYSLNLIIDDSGSMNANTDSNLTAAGDYMKQKFRGQHRQMTRWEEAQDRVHTLIDLITYVPTGPVRLSFMNRQETLQLQRGGRTPEQWAQDAHAQVDRVFARNPSGLTPTKRVLSQAFAHPQGPTMHYLFTDGSPSDTGSQKAVVNGEEVTKYPELEQLIMHRPNARQQPLCFVSCTDRDEEAEWMKVLEEAAPFCAEVDDYNDERAEVLKDQGAAFPYTKGFWLVCLLAAAINPDDLDAMDESAPFSKMTMDNMLGRVLTEQDYVHYFRSHPQEPAVRQHYQEFATAKATGKQIWQRYGIRAVPARPAAGGRPGGYSGY